MAWVRARRRFGGWLALFALALQLALTFGHHHGGDIGSSHAQAFAVQADVPADEDDDHGAGHDACAVCATLHLARTLVTPTPPAIVLPASRVLARFESFERQRAPRTAAHLFRARGPPQA